LEFCSGHYWTEEETEFMLSRLQECDITKCMDGRKKRNGYLFKRVSSALVEAGYNRTAEQIRVRWKNLKSSYFTIQNRQSEQDRKSCPHFHILDDLLGKCPTAQAAEHTCLQCLRTLVCEWVSGSLL
uniref:Myb-like domain-containing protein n=1 Tax=Neogobius melanostomus TaxID=47308 RepID=A0A8C6UXU0_9GOBI